MNVEIDGKKVTVPLCSCGKCLIRRDREGNRNTKYPYNRSMETTYTNSFQKKTNGISAAYFNRSVRNAFDGKYKEHLTSGLLSTMKFDFRPFMVKLDPCKNEEYNLENKPFYGRSTYDCNFPSWGISTCGHGPNSKLPLIQVPFRGNSNYAEQYRHYGYDYKASPEIKIKSSTLEFRGKILNESNAKESYQARSNPFSMEKPKRYDNQRNFNLQADYPKEFNTTYGGSFGNVSSRCELANYLKKSGKINLEI
jgi:hypothetical protein